MDRLKEGVGLRAYGQKDPLIEYKREGFELFSEMLDTIAEESLRIVFNSVISEPGEQRQRQTSKLSYVHEQASIPDGVDTSEAAESGTTGSGRQTKKQPIRVEKTPGRNDPCPCGSGKKYKKCCGA